MININTIRKYYIYEGDNIIYYNCSDLNKAIKEYIKALKTANNDVVFFGIQYRNTDCRVLEKDLFIGNKKFFRLCDNIDNIGNEFKINIFNKIKNQL